MPDIEDLLRTEMTRRQFLLTIGTAFAGLLGFSALMGLLTSSDNASQGGAPGYGMRDYGP